MDERYDTVVVGGGQAGLAVAYELRRAGRRFVVLDASARVGDAWRHRWDSLRLFTPAAVNALPGAPFPAPARHYPTKDEMADYLERYARDLPVRSATRVARVRAGGAGFEVVTDTATVRATRVVVATGAFTTPWVPPFAAEIDDRIHQLHSADYVSPRPLPPGPVLVVGAGNSGVEIALDVAASRRTLLAGRDTGSVPFTVPVAAYRLMARIRADRGAGHAAAARLDGMGSPVIRVRPADLAAVGVTRVPRVTDVVDGRPRLADGTTPDVGTVVWCTGFREELDWLPPGASAHDRGVVTAVPGLAFAGMRYQTTLASGIVAGAAGDARHVVSRVAPAASR